MAKKQLVGYLLASVLPLASATSFAVQTEMNSEFSDIYNVSADDNLIEANSASTNSPKKDSIYIYTVPFTGDIENAHSLAFDKLVNKLSGGAMNGSDLKFDIDSVISDENITDEGLQVVFDEKLVQKMVDDGVVVVWNGLSEPLIGWIVRGTMSQDNAVQGEPEINPSLAGTDSSDDFTNALIKEGQKQKVKFLLPVNDIDDLSAITIQDVLSNNSQPVKEASKRYSSGNSVIGVVTRGTDGKLYFSYHVYNLFNGREIMNGDLNGKASEIASAFYVELKRHAGALAGLNRTSEKATETKEEAKSDNGVLTGDKQVAGIKDSEHAVLQVFGLSGEEHIKLVIDELYAQGVLDVVMRPSAGSTFFDLTYANSFDCTNRLSRISHLKKRSDGLVYDFMVLNEPKSDIINISDDKSSALKEKNPYNKVESNSEITEVREVKTNTTTTPVAVSREERQKNGGSQRYPDPNKVLQTGGGVGK